MTGLAFLGSVGTLIGSLMILGGIILALLEAGRVEPENRLARRLEGWWESLGRLAWPELPAQVTARLGRGLESLVRRHFAEADRGPAFGIVFMGMVFILIPVAAGLNLAVGGSATLGLFYLSNLAILLALNFTGERPRLALLNTLMSFFVGVSLFIIVPAYVWRSFSDRLLYGAADRGFIASILVAPLLYFLAYGLMLASERVGWRSDKRAAPPSLTGLAAFPLAFVLFFAALQFGTAAVPERPTLIGWPPLLAALVLQSISFALILPLLRRAPGGGLRLARGYLLAGLVAALLCLVLFFGGNWPGPGGGLSEAMSVFLGRSPDGGRILLGADFWVMHLPFVPLTYFVAGLLAAALAKATISGLGAIGSADMARRKPILVAGIISILSGAITAGVASMVA